MINIHLSTAQKSNINIRRYEVLLVYIKYKSLHIWGYNEIILYIYSNAFKFIFYKLSKYWVACQLSFWFEHPFSTWYCVQKNKIALFFAESPSN